MNTRKTTAAALVSLLMLAGAWGLLAQTTPADAAGWSGPRAPQETTGQTAGSSRAKLLLRNPDGRVWEVAPPALDAGDRCEQIAVYSGVGGAAAGRCAYLRCRWLAQLAHCVERFTEPSDTGAACAMRDYVAISETQQAAARECPSGS